MKEINKFLEHYYIDNFFTVVCNALLMIHFPDKSIQMVKDYFKKKPYVDKEAGLSMSDLPKKFFNENI